MATELLERLLTRSTLYRAFQRVWENGGCRGSEGVTVGAFRDRLEWELDSIQDGLIRRAYHPLPLLRFAVPKGSGTGLRHLSVPTVRDRVVQCAVYVVTKERFEAELEDSSYAYREGRSVRQAVARLRDLRDAGYRDFTPRLPPPLDLRAYLELRHLGDTPCPTSTSPSRTPFSARPATA